MSTLAMDLHTQIEDAFTFVTTKALDAATGSSLPFVGTALGTLLQGGVPFLSNLESMLLSTVDGLDAASTPAEIAAAINKLGIAGISATSAGTNVQFHFIATDSLQTGTAGFDLAVGLPALGFTLSGGVSAALGYKLDLGLNFDTQTHILTTAPGSKEIELSLNASLDLMGNGKLGFIGVGITDNQAGPELSLKFALDIGDNMQIKDLLPDAVTTTVSGDAGIDLHVVSDLSTKLLPRLESNLVVGYHVADFDLASGLSGFGATPTIALNDIKLDLGSIVDFLASVFGPIINDIFGSFPIGPLIDIATAPLPIIDPAINALGLTKLFDEIGPDGVINLLDVAAYFGADKEVLSDFALAFSLIKGIANATGSGTATIDLGSLSLLGAAPTGPQNGNFPQNINDPSVDDATFTGPSSVLGGAISGLGGQLGGTPAPTPGLGGILEPLVKILNQAGLDIPLLSNPEQTVKALLLNGFGGPAVPLIVYDVPELSYVVQYKQFFPIIGPIGLAFSGQFGTKIDVNLGYDTTGLKTGNLADGFYLWTPALAAPMNGQHYAPVATVGVEVDASAGINLGFVSVEVGGGLGANLSAYFSGDDGNLRPSMASDCIIDPIAGQFDATVFVSFSVNFIFYQWSHRFDIADITLAEFSFGCDAPKSDPGHGLARIDTLTLPGVPVSHLLHLNVGDDAGLRAINGQSVNADNSKGEHYEIRSVHDANGIVVGLLDVTAYTVNEQYGALGVVIDRIDANLGDMRDVIVVGEDVTVGATLVGNGGDDLLVGGAGNDVLSGDDGIDHLIGGAGDDTLTGGADDDTIEGGLGADFIDGGSGRDQVTYEHSNAGVIFSVDKQDPGVFHGHGGEAEGDTLTNIEYIVGSHFNDRLYGNPDEDNTLEGLAGNDILVGGSGHDFLIGGAGADALIGGDDEDGTSYLTSSAGVVVDLPNGIGHGGDAEGDTYQSIEDVHGSVYDDVIIGDSGDNIIDGWFGDDQLSGGAGSDMVSGGEGNDTIYGAADGDKLDGGGSIYTKGHDLLTYERYLNSGGTGVTADLWSGKSDDKYNSSGDDDIARALVHKAVDENDDDVYAAHVSSFEDLTGSRYGDSLTGDDQGNVIRGLAGDDVIKGMAGNDTLVGGAGADVLDGGDGIDLADYIESQGGVTVKLGDFAAGFGLSNDAQGDTLVNIENLRGSDYNDTLTGSIYDNRIDPGLSRFGISDKASGGFGEDTLVLDYSRGDIGKGVIGGYNLGSFDSGSFSRQMLATAAQLDGVDFDTIERLEITGTSKDDIIFGGNSHDTIYGGRGNDVIFGGLGVDRLFGGGGNDLIVSGSDATRQLSIFGGLAPVQLDGGAGIDVLSISLASYAGNVVLTGTDGTAEFTGTNAALKNGTGISNFELIAAVITGDGDDKITQPGVVDNFFVTGFGVDEIRAGLGNDYIDGGLDYRIGSETTAPDANGVMVPIKSINALYANDGDLVVLDFSSLDTAVISGVTGSITPFSVNVGGVSTAVWTNNGYFASGSNLTEFVNIERLDVTGSSANDVLYGTDLLFGRNVGAIGSIVASQSARGDDRLVGGAGDDILIGNTGDDTLIGGDGNDLLLGAAIGNGRSAIVDLGEIDTLTGGKGADIFVLGTILGGSTDPIVYYSDGMDSAAGIPTPGDRHSSDSNRAIITDFQSDDHLLMAGIASDYRSVESGNSTFIYLRDGLDGSGRADASNDELIAELLGVSGFRLDSAAVIYQGDSAVASLNGPAIGARSSVSSVDEMPAAASSALGQTAVATLTALAAAAPHVINAPDAPLAAMTTPLVAKATVAGPALDPETGALAASMPAINPSWVTQTTDSNALRAALFDAPSAISQGTFTFQGDGAAFGTFNGDPFGLGHGIVISTGEVEQLAGVNLVDGGHTLAPKVDLHFVKIGRVGNNDIFRADLSNLGFDLKSIQLGDASSGYGGGGGVASGFDIGAVALSHTKLISVDDTTVLDSAAVLPRLDVFGFDAANAVFTPGSQRPSDANFGNAPDLLGAVNGLPLYGVDRLDRFDNGFLSLGDGGSLGLNLTQTVSTAGPLYLYVAETGASGEALTSGFTASADRLGAPADLSTDLGAPGLAGDDIALTYTFTPGTAAGITDPSLNLVTFDFVFFSEELVEFVQTGFNDTFKITLNGVNLALLSDGSAASIDTLYAPSANGNATSSINALRTDTIQSDFIYNPVGTGPAASQTRADGYSKVLHFSGAINPGVENVLRIQVTDARDGLLDSGILIGGGSFRAGSVNSFHVDSLNRPILEGETRQIDFGITVPTGGSETGTYNVTLHPTAGLDLGAGAGKDVVRSLSSALGLANHVTATALSDGLNNGARYESVSVDVTRAPPATGPATAGNVIVTDDNAAPFAAAPLVFEVDDAMVSVTRLIGDAPVRYNRAMPNAWADAWTAQGVHITHTADAGARIPTYSEVNFGTANPGLLSGADILAGDLGVSGKPVANAPGVVQEITVGEALRFQFDSHAVTGFSLDFARFERGDTARIDELDAAGNVIHSDFVSSAHFEASGLQNVAAIVINAASGAFVLHDLGFTESMAAPASKATTIGLLGSSLSSGLAGPLGMPTSTIEWAGMIAANDLQPGHLDSQYLHIA